MSQLYEMCQAIVNHPENELTVEDVIETMNGSGVNSHSIRCALSKIAARSVLVEPTKKHRGRVKIYKKRNDIDEQWSWMMSHKSSSDRLVMPDSATVVKSRNPATAGTVGAREHDPVPQQAVGYEKMLIKELANIRKALDAINHAIRENTKVLQTLEIGRPTVVVRKEKA